MNGPAAGDFAVGIIGYGMSGAAFHAPIVATTPGLRVAVIVTANAVRAAQAHADFPAAQVISSPEALIGGVRPLDLIVVASPNRTHVPLAYAAVRAGIPVVIEKPLARTVAEARALVDEARDRGVLLTVYQNRRWDGDFLTVQRLLAEGAVGEPLRFESRFDRWRPAPKPGWRESGAPEDAGGLLYDIGSHLIDQALLLFGPVEDAYAEVDRRRPGVAVDDDVFIALRHRTGVRSHLYATVLAAQPGPRMRLLGTRAAFTKFGLDVQEAALRSGARPGPGWGEEPPDRWGVLGTGDDLTRVRTEPGAYPAFYRQLVTALRGDGPVPVDPDDAIAALEVIVSATRV